MIPKDFKATWKIMVFGLCFISFVVGLVIGAHIGIDRAVGNLKEENKRMRLDISLIKAEIPDIKKEGDKLIKTLADLEKDIRLRVMWNKKALIPQGKMISKKPDDGE